jgi:hypothetical protein
MMTLILVTISILVSCTAAAGLIASVQNSADADQSMTGLAVDDNDLGSLVVGERE